MAASLSILPNCFPPPPRPQSSNWEQQTLQQPPLVSCEWMQPASTVARRSAINMYTRPYSHVSPSFFSPRALLGEKGAAAPARTLFFEGLLFFFFATRLGPVFTTCLYSQGLRDEGLGGGGVILLYSFFSFKSSSCMSSRLIHLIYTLYLSFFIHSTGVKKTLLLFQSIFYGFHDPLLNF